MTNKHDAHAAYALIEAVLSKHEPCAGALLPVLHDVQAALGCISKDAMQSIANGLNIGVAQVQGVVSFYDDFHVEAPLLPVIQLCAAEACQARGSSPLLRQLQADNSVIVERVFCLGNCACGPNARASGKLHARLNAEKIQTLVQEVLAEQQA